MDKSSSEMKRKASMFIADECEVSDSDASPDEIDDGEESQYSEFEVDSSEEERDTHAMHRQLDNLPKHKQQKFQQQSQEEEDDSVEDAEDEEDPNYQTNIEIDEAPVHEDAVQLRGEVAYRNTYEVATLQDDDNLRLVVSSINLQLANERELQKDALYMEASINAFCRKWCELDAQLKKYALSVHGRKKFEDELVNRMNSWIGLVTENSKDNSIVLRYITRQGNFGVLLKNKEAMRQMFECWKVRTYDKEKEFTRDNFYITTTLKEMVPKGARKDPKTGEYIRPPSMLVLKSIFDIWWDHPNKKKYCKVYFSPKPHYLTAASNRHDLNTWSGYAPGYVTIEFASLFLLL